MTQTPKPMTEMIIKHKQKQNLEEFAQFLETIAQKLRQEGQFTFVQQGKEVIVSPNEMITTEIEYSKKGDKHSFEIEFDWVEGEKQLGSFEIK